MYDSVIFDGGWKRPQKFWIDLNYIFPKNFGPWVWNIVLHLPVPEGEHHCQTWHENWCDDTAICCKIKKKWDFFLWLGILPLHFGLQHSTHSHSLIFFLAVPKNARSGKDIGFQSRKKMYGWCFEEKYEGKCGKKCKYAEFCGRMRNA